MVERNGEKKKTHFETCELIYTQISLNISEVVWNTVMLIICVLCKDAFALQPGSLELAMEVLRHVMY